MKQLWPKEGLWVPERVWEGQTVFVLGGGPSVNSIDIELLRGANVVGVNNAYQKWPHCQFLMYHDRRWGEWHAEKLKFYQGSIITTSKRASAGVTPKAVLERKHPPPAISDSPREVVGLDIGAQGVNLAMHLGAKQIVLLGFDMSFDEKTGESHWHEDHKVVSREQNYTNRFSKQYPLIQEALGIRGIELVRGTNAGILDFIPYLPIEEILCNSN